MIAFEEFIRLVDGHMDVFLVATPRDLDEFGAGLTDGVRPVDALCVGDAAGDLVEEIGGWDGTVEGGVEVAWKGIQCLLHRVR